MKILKPNQDYPMPKPGAEIEALELKLSRTASKWRETKDAEYVKQYHDIYHKLRSLGWDAGIDVDAELPDRLMPQEYLDQIHARAGK
jgi:hypothetical protein